eukprot:1265376-Pleurochrysis_carterae.AAC.2
MLSKVTQIRSSAVDAAPQSALLEHADPCNLPPSNVHFHATSPCSKCYPCTAVEFVKWEAERIHCMRYSGRRRAEISKNSV